MCRGWPCFNLLGCLQLGVILLEMFIHRRPTDAMFKDGLSIAKFTEINFPDNVLQIVDPQLLQELNLGKGTPWPSRTVEVEHRSSAVCSLLSIGLCWRVHQHAGGGCQAARGQGCIC